MKDRRVKLVMVWTIIIWTFIGPLTGMIPQPIYDNKKHGGEWTTFAHNIFKLKQVCHKVKRNKYLLKLSKQLIDDDFSVC